MSECGLIFNRHQWEPLGRDENQHLFQACKKCGEVEEIWVEMGLTGHVHRTRSVSFFEAKIRIRVAKRHEEELIESRKQALAFLDCEKEQVKP